jgi:dimethylaniline monooxygenase (N-oxide forming)
MELESGGKIKADAVVYCTGWQPSIDFFSPEEAAKLGIPVPREESDVRWEKLMADADVEVRKLLPFLATGAREANETPAYSQFRMYRQILSPRLLAEDDTSIAFVGFVSTGQTAQCYELLSLWGVAWLEGLLPKRLPTQEEMEQEVARVNACMARRYGARGAKDPEIILESQLWFDTLMRDLDLMAKRKQQGMLRGWQEWFLPYTAADYRGVVDEFLNKSSKRQTLT